MCFSCYRIDFVDNSKPANLANSAVLKMLEEEENQKRHGRQPGECSTVQFEQNVDCNFFVEN